MQLILGAEFGTARYHRIESASDFGFGPLAGMRLGVQLLTWASLEARGFITRHESIGAVVTRAAAVEGRLCWPSAVRPFVAAGFGRYDVTAYDASGTARVAPDSAAAVPLSVGAEAVVHDGFLGVQAQLSYWLLYQRDKPAQGIALASLWGATMGGHVYF